MNRSIPALIVCASLLPGCAALRQDRVVDRQRDFSPVVALAAFQHCTSELTSDADETRLRSVEGEYELAIEYDDDGTVISRFVVTPKGALPEDAQLLERCAGFAKTYFGYAFADIGATRWSQPVTVRGTFFPIDAAEVTEADGSVQPMGLAIDRLSRSVTGSSLYRLSYYERDPESNTDPNPGEPLEIRLESIRP